MGRGPPRAHCSGQVTGLRTQGRHQLFWGRGAPPMKGVSLDYTPGIQHPLCEHRSQLGLRGTQCSPDSGSLTESPPAYCPQVDEMARLAPQTPGALQAAFRLVPPHHTPTAPSSLVLYRHPQCPLSLHFMPPATEGSPSGRTSPQQAPPGPALVLTQGPSQTSTQSHQGHRVRDQGQGHLFPHSGEMGSLDDRDKSNICPTEACLTQRVIPLLTVSMEEGDRV